MAANRIQLQNALHKPYDRVLFSRELLSPVFGSGFTLNSSLVPASVSPNKSESAAIDKVWIYGKIQLDDSTEITCYEVLLQPKVRIEQSKVAIQQYVRKLLTAGQAALINFVAPANKNVWRLTLVAKDSVLTDKGVKEKTTNAKRYTFLLGPSETCKTAAERFEVLSTEKEITFQTLVNAFSVEKLSKAFFDEYTLHYQNFCKYLQDSNYRKSVFNISFPVNATEQEKDKASKPIRDFVKKLLGRIVFLYFVQKKGWLGANDTNYSDGIGDFIKQLFHKSGGNEAFYSNWLAGLFFETLNKERINDDFKMPDGKIVKVPFLNGGLFDKEEFDEHVLTFKSKLFHHPDFEDAILTLKSNGLARGFLDFLDAFNFTVYEDSPDDHTVAVDPEMLGHIFENLLEDNKDKGAFYTPKEIVHYMCQESLTEYLCTTLQIKDEVAEREAVNQLLKSKIVDDVLKPEIVELEKALDNVKICDPAIGSGAFPMGLLQEIFSIKELIAYETGNEWKPAETKLNIIQNSIYGVDIEKGAVDIARLRFWLSLVVDEEKPKALPNLDYKIVVGDSLISKFDGEIVEIDWERKSSVGKADEYVKNVQRLLLEVADKQKKYFNPNNKNKKILQAEIRNLKIELLINQLSYNKLAYAEKTPQKGGFMPTASDIKHNTERLLQIAGFDNLISKLKHLLQHPDEPFNHFDWKLDFPEVLNPYLVNGNGGFDIVIANPPFVDSENMIKTQPLVREYLSNKFLTTKGNWDLYIPFHELALSLLKENGFKTFISPNKWLSIAYAKEFRKKFKKYLFKVCNCNNVKVFEAGVTPVISLFNNCIRKKISIDVVDSKFNFYNSNIIDGNLVDEDSLGILLSNYSSILILLKSITGKFKDYINCENPFSTSEAYILSDILQDNSKSNNIFKFINTGTIDPYISLWGIKTTTYLKNKYDYPIIPQKIFKEYFPKRLNQAQNRKLIITGMRYLECFYDMRGEYIAGKSTLIIKDVKGDYFQFFCGLLNSKLISFYVKQSYSTLGIDGGVNFTKDIIEDIPLPTISNNDIKKFSHIVNYIIYQRSERLKNLEEQIIPVYFEQIIDGMVYDLYFPELLKKHNREIIKHLDELPEFTDGMSDEQKMMICKKVFDRLNDKEHPIRINLFYMNSIPEIAIIEGKNENN